MAKKSAITKVTAVVIAAIVVVAATIGSAVYYVSVASAPEATSAQVLKVALIMEGPEKDKSWNEFHAENLRQLVAESKGSIVAEYSDNVSPADFARVAEDFAKRGFNFIIGDSNNYQPPALQMADKFPKVNFAVFGAFEFRPNLVGYTTWAHEGAFLAGYLGGLTTKTGKLGVVVAFKFASQLAYWNGFIAGAKKAADERKIQISVVPSWTGTWTDPAKGFEAAKAMFDAGTDFIAHDASGPGAGALRAAGERGILAVGAFVDESYVGTQVVTSVLFRFDGPMREMIRDIRDGKFGGKSYDFTLRDGAIDLAPISEKVPKEIRDKVLAVKQQILQGLVRVPFVPDRELSSGT